jgi:hypothetical protein
MVARSTTLTGYHAKLGEAWLKSEAVFPEKSYHPSNYFLATISTLRILFLFVV